MRRLFPILYITVNVACACMVLYAVHRIATVMAMEHRTESDSVDGITFFVMAAPAFGVAVLANMAWAGKAFVDLARRRDNRALLWLGSGMAIWCIVILIGRVITP